MLFFNWLDQHSKGEIAAFQINLGCPFEHERNGHLCKTIDVPLVSWIASSHEIIQSLSKNES
jgi:hypothetical protein